MNLGPYLYGIVLIIGLYGGYEFRDNQAEAEKAAAVIKAVKFANDNAEISRAEDIALIKAQQKTQIVYKTITKEVPKYVPVIQKNDSECNLSVGTVRLLNSAARDELPETAAIDDPADTGPSHITEAAFIDHGFDIINRYNVAKNQCNAIFEWYQKQQLAEKERERDAR